jgi:hypothetical protein
MSFKEFENALELLASNKGVPGEELRQKVAASAGPMCNATQATAVRLHDDRSTYTGQQSQCRNATLQVVTLAVVAKMSCMGRLVRPCLMLRIDMSAFSRLSVLPTP